MESKLDFHGKKGLISWAAETYQLILEDIGKLEQENIDSVSLIAKSYADAFAVDQNPKGDMNAQNKLLHSLASIELNMADNYDFEIVPSSRGEMRTQGTPSPGLDKLASAAANNLGRIIDVAESIVEIQKMQAQADACISMLCEQQRMPEQEPEAYVKRGNADTNSVVNKVEVIRRLMHDYYSSGQGKLSGEEFSNTISNILDHMGDL